MKRIIIQIVLIAAAAFLAYLLWNTIQEPIRFDQERSVRYRATVERLIDIRKAQVAYREVNGQFSGNWDSLVRFVKYDSIPQIRRIGMLTDSMVEAGLTERTAMLRGLIIRDTVRISVIDHVFTQSFKADSLRYVPYSGGQEFWLGQTIITTGSGVRVPVFEARAHNNQFLNDLKEDYEQLIINLNEQRRKNNLYPGLRVGSVTEANNNAGNWE